MYKMYKVWLFNKKVPESVPGRKSRVHLLKQMVCSGSTEVQGCKDRLILHYEGPSMSA